MLTIAGGILLALLAVMLLPVILPIFGGLVVVCFFVGIAFLLFQFIDWLGLDGIVAIVTGVVSLLIFFVCMAMLSMLIQFLKNTRGRNRSLMLEIRRIVLSSKPAFSISAKLDKIKALHQIEELQLERENAAKAFCIEGHERLIVKLVEELTAEINRHLPENKFFITRCLQSHTDVVVSVDTETNKHLPKVEICHIKIETKPRTANSFDSTYVFTQPLIAFSSKRFNTSAKVCKESLKVALSFVRIHPKLLLTRGNPRYDAERIDPSWD